MKTPRVLLRFLVSYLLLHLLTAGFFVIVFSSATRHQMVENAKGEMRSLALVLRAHIQELPEGLENPSLIPHVLNLGEKTDFRYTIINASGDVVADSEKGDQDIGPHGDRPEIVDANSKGLGFSARFSDTLQLPMMYLAIPLENPNHQGLDQSDLGQLKKPNKPTGFVRVAAPAVPINRSIQTLQRTLWTYALLLGAISAGLMIYFASSAMRPLSRFSETARNIGRGELQPTVPLESRRDEWGELADAFGQMQKEISVREEQLREGSHRLTAVLKSMIEGVLSTDGQGRISITNRAAQRMLSFTHSEVLDRDLLEIIRYPELRLAVETARANQSTEKTEFETLPPARRRIKARATYLPEESPRGVAIVLHDVTELRALENMRQDFVANVSHELKTPLASIQAYAETLRLGAIHDEDKNIQFVEQIETQAKLLNLQIQDLLEIARVESGTAAFKIEPVAINELCQRSVDHIQAQAAQLNVKLSIEPAESELMARAESDGVTTIVNNLISNAIRYTPADGQVIVRTRREDDWVIIEVADTGIGISAEHQARVFERFYRADKARSRDMGGTGLGLAIVKHLTQAFDGKVELESQVGKGSSFRVSLPAG